MRRRAWRAVTVAVATLVLGTCGPAPRRPPAHKIDRIFAELDRTDSPGCAVGVIREGAFVFRKGYGQASLELGVPNATDTVYYVGSVSKQFVAASVAIAAREGHLSLGDDIRRYLPEIPDYGAPITLRHLIHHTSGLRDYLALMSLAGMRYEDVHTEDELLALVARQKGLCFAPGDEHLYSNSGYFLLAQVVKRATGRSLREYAAERIFEPLGMVHTRFHDDRTEVVPGRAMAYASDGEGGFRLRWYLNFDQVGSGGLLTTVEDLLLWDRAFYSDTLAGGGLVGDLLERGTLNDGTVLDYAFALEHGVHRGLATLDHPGAFMGFRAQLLRFPTERVSVITLCNVAEAEADRLARSVAEVVLAGRFPEPPARRRGAAHEVARAGGIVRPGSEKLETYTGRFFSEELQATYVVAAEGDALTLRRGGLAAETLAPTGPDQFESGDLRVVFDEAVGGEAPGLTAHADRVRDIRFERIAR